MKTCTGPCGLEKPLEDFPNDKYKKSGKKSRCKSCEREAARVRRNMFPDKCREASKKYRTRNKEKERARYTRYNKENPHVRASLAASRRAGLKSATPVWLSDAQKQNIKDIYLSAKTMSEKFSTEYHVDHIVPLNGLEICGLHVPWNLQILEKSLNKAKSNSYDPEAIIYHRGPKNSGCGGHFNEKRKPKG